MKLSNIRLGLTYDDILLVPQKSAVVPSEVTLKSYLTPKIQLNIPVISAAMDTVTEANLAIALAREGGIGMIHKNMSIEAQARQVELVKRNESGMISDPITLKPYNTIRDVQEVLAQYKISGLPVVDDDGKLVGIITNRDLRYLPVDDTPVSEVMTKNNLVTAKAGVSLDEAQNILWEHRIEKLPIVDDDGKLVGLITSKDIDNRQNFPNAAKDKQGRLLCGAAVGVGADTLNRVKALVEAEVDVITVDSAHGHSKNIIETVKAIRKAYPDLQIIAGNIVTDDTCSAAGQNKVGVCIDNIDRTLDRGAELIEAAEYDFFFQHITGRDRDTVDEAGMLMS